MGEPAGPSSTCIDGLTAGRARQILRESLHPSVSDGGEFLLIFEFTKIRQLDARDDREHASPQAFAHLFWPPGAWGGKGKKGEGRRIYLPPS